MARNVPNTSMGNFGVAYDINAINNLALKAGVKPLTQKQLAGMSQEQVKQWVKVQKQTLAMNRKNFRKSSRQIRKNTKPVLNANDRQAQMMHTTIRQGLAELGGLGAQGVAQLGLTAISKPSASMDAIQQNTSGGTETVTPDDTTEKGPVYAKRQRDEE